MSAGLFNSIVALLTLAGLAWLLYRPKIQESGTYKATVVPLAEIMDVGFIVFSPVIILLFGYDATWAMLGLCLLAILTGFAISYNISNYEPLIGKPDPLHRWNSIALWALLAASVVNVGLLRPAADDAGVAAVGRPLLARTRHRYRRSCCSASSRSTASQRA